MDGLINLHKPPGLTSAQALYRVRKITGVRKSGHAGTLDPAAEGVLVLCLGRATKLVEALMDQPKVYRAAARLDVTSDSFDSDRPLRPVPVDNVPAAEQVAAALRGFEGQIMQVPPAVSALKVGGRPAYKLERAGRPPALAARPAHIYWVHMHAYAWPELDYELACGRGTYVRALVRDLGATLGTGGCLTGLLRRAVGPLHVDAAWTLDALAAAGDWTTAVLPMDEARRLLAQRPVPLPPRPTQA
jgi:tRNA pseudouridine55 synthase